MTHGGWCILLLLCSLAHGSLYVSLSGSTNSTTCTSSDPCASISQAVQVHAATTPGDPFQLAIQSGSYTGPLNTHVTLPENVPSTIEQWGSDPNQVTLQFTNVTKSAFFVTASDLTLVGLRLMAESNSLVQVPSSLPPDQEVNLVVQGGKVSCSKNLVLLKHTSSVRLTLNSIELTGGGLFQSDWNLSLLTLSNTSVTAKEMSLHAGSITVTGCHFQEMDAYAFHTFDCNYTLTWTDNYADWRISMVKLFSTLSLRAGNIVYFTHSTFIAYSSMDSNVQLQCASFVMEDSSLDIALTLTCSEELIIRGSDFSNPSLAVDVQSSVQQIILDRSTWSGCDIPIQLENPTQITVTNCTFLATGGFVLGAQDWGMISDTLISKGRSFQLTLSAGDWTLSNTTFSYSSGTTDQALYFSSPEGLTLKGCHFDGSFGSNGRAVWVKSGNLNVENSLFENIDCISNGCAILSNGEDTTITDTTFQSIYGQGSNNEGGGAVVAGSTSSDTIRIQSSTFISCQTQNSYGGAVSLGGNVVVTGCYFEDCSAAAAGGAIYLVEMYTAEVSFSQFAQCEDAIYVGAAPSSVYYNDEPDGVTLQRLIFEDSGPDVVSCISPEISVNLNDSQTLMVDGSTQIKRGDIANCLVVFFYGSPHYSHDSFFQALVALFIIVIFIAAGLMAYQIYKLKE